MDFHLNKYNGKYDGICGKCVTKERCDCCNRECNSTSLQNGLCRHCGRRDTQVQAPRVRVQAPRVRVQAPQVRVQVQAPQVQPQVGLSWIPAKQDEPSVESGPTCLVCVDRAPSCVAIPCGHTNMCTTCIQGIKAPYNCPTCRANVTNFVYMRIQGM